MDTIYNCHTHIFNAKCAPAGFYGRSKEKLITKFLYLPKTISMATGLLRFANPLKSDDTLEKFSNMLWVGTQKSQEEIFLDLLEKYNNYPSMKIVALALDMDYMGGGKPLMNYKTQLWELFKLKIKYQEKILPFLCIDPRRDTAEGLLNMTREYIENKGFSGIKLYPPLGFYPFHPNLNLVYAYAEQHNIPIMSHCDTGGICFQGVLSAEHLDPLDLDEKSAFEKPLTREANEKFKLHFTNPENYYKVLEKYPKLKICLAHFGGYRSVRGESIGLNWYAVTKDLIRKHANVYTDISYTLFDDKIFETIKKDIEEETIGNKILFGTDYYMTEKEKKEVKLIEDFKLALSRENFKRIAVTNPEEYLRLSLPKIEEVEETNV